MHITKSTIILVSVLIGGLIQAQPVVNYSVGNVYFYAGDYHYSGGGGDIFFITEVLKDTVIGEFTYFVLQRSWDFRHFCSWTPSIDTGTIFVQRSDSARLFQYDPSTATDILLVDFTDTVNTLYPQFGNGYMYLNGRDLVLGDSLQSPLIHFATPITESYNGVWNMGYSEVFGRTSFGYAEGVIQYGGAYLVGALVAGIAYGDTTVITTIRRDAELGGFALHPTFPNPFNSTVTISYSIPVAARVALTIFDMAGRVISTSDHGILNPGLHYSRWDASSLSSGIYFVRLNAGYHSMTRKCLLLK